MGTRSDIIVHRADGKWARIYCHWDGYLEHNGSILFNHYTSQAKCDKLVGLGDLSSLDKECTKPKGHSYENKVEGYTVAYGRDRKETGTAAKVGDSLSEVWPGGDTGTEYTYVFCQPEGTDAPRWFVGDPDEGSQAIVDLALALTGEKKLTPAIKAFGGNFVIGKHSGVVDPTRMVD